MVLDEAEEMEAGGRRERSRLVRSSAQLATAVEVQVSTERHHRLVWPYLGRRGAGDLERANGTTQWCSGLRRELGG